MAARVSGRPLLPLDVVENPGAAAAGAPRRDSGIGKRGSWPGSTRSTSAKAAPAETLARLTEYTWSGNVRELEKWYARLVMLTDGEQAIEPW